MREIYKSGVTPQQKLVAINNKFGNSDIKNQQGTTRIIYDTLALVAGQSTFRFFEDSSSRTFPFTNTGSEGNKLGVGDTMVVGQVVFSLYQYNPSTGVWIYSNLLASSPTQPLSYFNLEIANNQVIKKVTLTEQLVYFQKDTTENNNVIDLETSIVIPPLLPYIVEYQSPVALLASLPSPQTGFSYYLECQIIGVGGIIAPRTTF
jgi:hypothetical protein